MLKETGHEYDERAQMLLASGLVLLMSLLSMAVFGVKVAGLGTPHDPGSDAVIETGRELQLSFGPLIENRTQAFIDAGLSESTALQTALNSTHDDLLHHGEIRGVELKLLEPEITQQEGVWMIDVEAGISDSHAMYSLPLHVELDF